MITKIEIHINKTDLEPAKIEWVDDVEDYVFTQIPERMTRGEFIELCKELKETTNWED